MFVCLCNHVGALHRQFQYGLAREQERRVLPRAGIRCRLHAPQGLDRAVCAAQRAALKRSDTLHHTATHCNTLQHVVTRCNTLQHAATRCNTLQHTATNCVHSKGSIEPFAQPKGLLTMGQHTATHCTILQRTVTHCNTLLHTACTARARSSRLRSPKISPQKVSCLVLAYCILLQQSGMYCNTLQHNTCIARARSSRLRS